MKSFKILAGAFVAMVLSITACQKEIPVVGVDPTKPAPEDVAIDLETSTTNTLTVQWDVTKAVAAGAVSFTAQIPAEQDLGDVYDKAKSITVFKDDEINNFVTFSKLNEYDQFYVRVRANYPRSVFSEWVYINIDGNPVKYEMGHGLVNSALTSVEGLDYNEALSSNTAVAMDVESSAAESKGATTVRMQLLDRTTGARVKDTFVDLPSDGTVVATGCTKDKFYKVRARAEYVPDNGDLTQLAEWVYFKNDTTEVIKVGKGPAVPPTIPPVAREVEMYKTSSTLAFEWSETEFTSAEGDAGIPCKIELFTDKGCSSLVYGVTSDKASNWYLVGKTNVGDARQPRFMFGGLKPGTKYYFRMTDTSSGLSTDPIEATTADFQIVVPGTTPAQAGDIILGEDFGELAVGTYSTIPNDTKSGKAPVDYVTGFCGSGSLPTTPKAGTADITNEGYAFAGPDSEHGLFNTLKTGLSSTRLDKWGVINEDGATNKGYVCERTGHLKMGASSLYGLVVTPELTNLEKTAKIKISFKVAPYTEKFAVKERPLGQIAIVAPGASRDDYRTVSGNVTVTDKKFKIPGTATWEKFECEIAGVEPGSRIAIGSSRDMDGTYGTASGQARFFLDEITIQLVEYEVSVGGASVKEVNMEDNKGVIVFNEAANVAEYVVKIKQCGIYDDNAWVEFKSTTPEVAITGLKKLTEYHMQAKTIGTNGKETSWTPIQIIKTTDKVFKYPYTISNVDDLIDWLELGANNANKPGTAILAADLDLSKVAFTPAEMVAGIVLDGAGHTITVGNAPIFAKMGGTVKNLTIAGSMAVTAAEDVVAGHPVAPLAIVSTGTVTNCTNKATVSLTSAGKLGSPVVAGLVAYQEGGDFTGNVNEGAITLTHAGTANVSIDGFNRKPFSVIGGVVGVLVNTTADNCKNNGAVKVVCTNVAGVGARHYVGGVIGTPDNATVNNCINNGAVTADFNENATTKTSNGKQIYVGGVTGGRNGDASTDGGNMDKCENFGTLTLITDYSANNYLGGITGQQQIEGTDKGTKITNCTNNGKLIKEGVGGARVGGISGGAATLDGCTNKGEIVINGMEAGRAVGGLVGYPTQTFHTIVNCKSLGNITCNANTAYYVGGIGGQGGNTVQSYTACSINCTITAPAAVKAGMLLGYVGTLTKTITIGTADAPVKVKGTINGTTLTADNYSSYLLGSPTTGTNGKVEIVAVYGE